MLCWYKHLWGAGVLTESWSGDWKRGRGQRWEAQRQSKNQGQKKKSGPERERQREHKLRQRWQGWEAVREMIRDKWREEFCGFLTPLHSHYRWRNWGSEEMTLLPGRCVCHFLNTTNLVLLVSPDMYQCLICWPWESFHDIFGYLFIFFSVTKDLN